MFSHFFRLIFLIIFVLFPQRRNSTFFTMRKREYRFAMKKREQKIAQNKVQTEDYTYAFIVIFFLFFSVIVLSPTFPKLLEVGIINTILDILNLK